MRFSLVAALLPIALLSACSGGIVPPSQAGQRAASLPTPQRPSPQQIEPARPMAAVRVPATVAGPNAKSAGVTTGPAFDTLGVSEEAARRALKSFQSSCPAMLRRTDLSGLTVSTDWQPACSAANNGASADPLRFFAENFEVAQIGDGKAFATGYYIPEIAGSRTRRSGYDVPIYAKPPELVEIDLGEFSDGLKGKKIRGQVKGNRFVPFADRTEIEEGTLQGRGLEIAWAKDAIDFFVLQIQGSGNLRLPDGGLMKIGYDGQNGRDYTGIGKVMRDRNLLAPGKANMQGITEWLRANPEQGKAIMRENRSWVFFRELTKTAAVGALNVEVIARTSVAADPMFTPLGAPVFLLMDRAEPNGLWVAQDTGGAIKGANRFDTFWGAGAEAERLAGGMSARGTAFLLLPIGTIARIDAGSSPQR
jgi:membrane-bound lytic murein transglycosylase A